ncbi:hypothetical protein [Archangium sp.]|uniref:hypothetical protein n=1 Tax=Archangium sp. TaxID=1872627 RepID=UPI002D33B134|nr:hypothetical protein [Archangium sp.]HYO58210.1 hypothetical protein [Archangium sp.]
MPQAGASADYQQELAARGIQCGMSRKGNCWDNAVVESFFATIPGRTRVGTSRNLAPCSNRPE